MKARYRSLPLRQRGSFYSTVFIILLFGIVLTAALKIGPLYLDNRVIVNTMESMADSGELAGLSEAEIRTRLMRTLNVNNVQLDGQAVRLVREGDNEYVEIDYESRVALFFNISAVVSFDNRFDRN